MAVYTNAGGGGGASSDELTATRGDVLKGVTAVTSDSNDEAIEGTLELTGDAADSHVLEGKTYYNKDAKTRRTGAMPNRGAANQILNAGQSYTIPAGYHNGGGRITANGLAIQTPANAPANRISAGYTAWVNGVLVTGSMQVQSAYSFNIAAVDCQNVNITWTNPSTGPYSGVFIQMSTGGYPGSIGGQRVYTGLGWNSNAGGVSGCTISGLSPNTTYYFTVTSYCTVDGGTRDMWSEPIQLAAYTPSRPIGSQTFTASGIFTVPGGVYYVDVCLVGGGGAGGSSGRHAGGGGAGYVNNYYGIGVSPGQQIAVTVGQGGQCANSSSGIGGNGGASYFGSYGASGGFGGTGGSRGGSPATVLYYKGGDGGSGGGNPYTPTGGGSDGSDGLPGGENHGIGQHFTTRAFGGTLYAGGGAGENDTVWKASGGAGGGGNSRENGAPNTGGGGGAHSYATVAGNGGSGIVLVRWGY